MLAVQFCSIQIALTLSLTKGTGNNIFLLNSPSESFNIRLLMKSINLWSTNQNFSLLLLKPNVTLEIGLFKKIELYLIKQLPTMG